MNKAELIKAVKEGTIEKVMANKMEVLKNADSFGAVVQTEPILGKSSASEANVINKTFIGNTYNWLDSHGDVHVDNTFSESIDQNKDVFHLHDHEFKLTSRVGDIQSVYESVISWKSLGVDIEGTTTALFVNSNISKDLNTRIFSDYNKGLIKQHSVGMRYKAIELAIDAPEDEELAAYNETFQKYINQIGNKQAAIDAGSFWAVSKAELIEVSAVLRGSNVLTGMVEEQKGIDYKYLVENYKTKK